MTSTYSGATRGTASNEPKRDHDLRVAQGVDIPEITYRKSVANGTPVNARFRVCGMRYESARGTFIPVQRCDTYQQYAAGCVDHGPLCYGHFCVTPRGTVLVPQRLASTVGVMSNEFAKMAESVFSRDTKSQELTYRARLAKLMTGKRGMMRGDLPAGVVDGSARQIISTSWELEQMNEAEGSSTIYFAIPVRVAENMRVLKVPVDEETGTASGVYVEDRLREGDDVVIVRPPSLWAGNVQPAKVVLWNHECFGLPPSVAADFHADHDGDEMHIYYVGTPSSKEECSKWHRQSSNKFSGYADVHGTPLGTDDSGVVNITNFMQYTTMSVRELLTGSTLPGGARMARVKPAMVDMLAVRMKDPSAVRASFVAESRRGIRDVMAQQMDQGLIGDMGRQARLAASCVRYDGGGTFSIMTSNGVQRTRGILDPSISHDPRYPLGGNSCMRAISMICAVAQQAALDSHRVSLASAVDMDLVHNLLQGGSETLVQLRGTPHTPCSWSCRSRQDQGLITYALIDPRHLNRFASDILASYSPVALGWVNNVGGDVRAVCKRGILMVCGYYDVHMSELEVASAVELLVYQAGLHSYPITSKTGMKRRGLRWLPTVLAGDYNSMDGVLGDGRMDEFTAPQTISEATAMCNFAHL